MTTPPRFIEPQLSTLVKAPPAGEEWVHEIKYDGYRMAIHFAGPKVQLLTRTGLDWTDRYPDVAKAAAKLRLKDAYIDGELCEVRKDGTTGFPEEGSENIAFFAFDLLFHDGKDMMRLPLADRKAQLEKRLKKAGSLIRYAEHIDGEGNRVLQAACTMKVEGVISKRRNAPYVPGDRATWQKIEMLQSGRVHHCWVYAIRRQPPPYQLPFAGLL
jgi:bifunctional non-homologous end joining protein LigD